MSSAGSPISTGVLSGSHDQRELGEAFYFALTYRGEPYRLSKLLSQVGYPKACNILSTILADPIKLDQVGYSYYAQNKQFLKAPDTVKAMLAFRFYVAGLRWEAFDLIRSIKNPCDLEQSALLEVYLMHENKEISSAVLGLIESDAQTLIDLNTTWLEMQDTFKHQQRQFKWLEVSPDDARAVKAMTNRIEQYVPEIVYESGVRMMAAIAKFPGNINGIRDRALSNCLNPSHNYIATNRVETINRILIGLSENPHPQSVYSHAPFLLARAYSNILELFIDTMKISSYAALQALGNIQKFSNTFILPQHRAGVLSFDNELYRTVAHVSYEMLCYPFSTTQLSILIELARPLNKDFLALATCKDKPVKKLMAIAPLIELDYFHGIYQSQFKDELRRYATKIVKHYSIRPSKVVANIETEQAASMVRLILDYDMAKRSGNDLLLAYALEQDLGL